MPGSSRHHDCLGPCGAECAVHRCHLLVRLMSSRLHRSRASRTATGPDWEGLRLARVSGVGPQGETAAAGVGLWSKEAPSRCSYRCRQSPQELVAWSDATLRFGGGLIVSPDGGVASWARQLAAALNCALVYERGATDVTTTVDGVIAAGRGVCQDFAHVFVALCRLRGVAAVCERLDVRSRSRWPGRKSRVGRGQRPRCRMGRGGPDTGRRGE